MFSRDLLIVSGVPLLLVGVAAIVHWVTDFTALKDGLLDGVPFFFDRGGHQVQISGRVVGVIPVGVPLLGAVGGWWLLRSAFEKDNEPRN